MPHPLPTPTPTTPHPAADESPFAVRQRLYAALPLPLGATSACEWLEVVLTQRFEAEDVRARLQVSTAPGSSDQSVQLWQGHTRLLARLSNRAPLAADPRYQPLDATHRPMPSGAITRHTLHCHPAGAAAGRAGAAVSGGGGGEED